MPTRCVLLPGLAFYLSLLATGPPVLAGPVEFKAGQFTSSKVCGSCHKDIYKVWTKKSVHAQACRDPVFQASYRQAIREMGDGARALCLRCHAPTTVLTKDYDAALPLTQEGITCDFCHSLQAVRVGDLDTPFDVAPGPVKRGPIKDARPTEHEAAYSTLHTSALLCAGCHEYTNRFGVPAFTTYSEWQAGPYPGEGTVCQGCHMPLVRADVVDPQIKRAGWGFVNLHQVPGGHALDQLQRALTVEVSGVRRTEDRLTVEVALTNTGAGHKIPTGIPTRRVVLSVDVEAEHDRRLHEERVCGLKDFQSEI